MLKQTGVFLNQTSLLFYDNLIKLENKIFYHYCYSAGSLNLKILILVLNQLNYVYQAHVTEFSILKAKLGIKKRESANIR